MHILNEKDENKVRFTTYSLSTPFKNGNNVSNCSRWV